MADKLSLLRCSASFSTVRKNSHYRTSATYLERDFEFLDQLKQLIWKDKASEGNNQRRVCVRYSWTVSGILGRNLSPACAKRDVRPCQRLLSKAFLLLMPWFSAGWSSADIWRCVIHPQSVPLQIWDSRGLLGSVAPPVTPPWQKPRGGGGCLHPNTCLNLLYYIVIKASELSKQYGKRWINSVFLTKHQMLQDQSPLAYWAETNNLCCSRCLV